MILKYPKILASGRECFFFFYLESEMNKSWRWMDVCWLLNSHDGQLNLYQFFKQMDACW